MDGLELDTASSGDVQVLPLEWRIFAAEVAEGKNYAEAAVSVGFSKHYGDVLAKEPGVVRRIARLSEIVAREENGIVDRVWGELVLLRMVKSGLEGEVAVEDADGKVVRPGCPPDRELVMSAFAQLSKIKGWIVERRATMNARVDYNQLGAGQLEGLLGERLGMLSPEQQATVQALAAGQPIGVPLQPQAGKSRRGTRRTSVATVVVDVEPSAEQA